MLLLSAQSFAESSADISGKHQRIGWIDIGKGIGIILVSFGHLPNGVGNAVSTWLPAINPTIDAIDFFRMPLFYFLGGLVFSARKPFRQFILRKVCTLIVPYYIFSTYMFVREVVALRESGSQTIKTLVGFLFYGNGLWFLWAYFCGEILAYVIRRLFSHLQHLRIIIYVCSGLVLICISRYLRFHTDFVLPFQLIRGIEATGFILLGIVAKSFLFAITRLRAVAVCVPVMIAYIISSVAAISAKSTHPLLYDGMTFIALFSGVLAFVLLSIVIGHNRILQYIGRASIVFYAVNFLSMTISKTVFFRLLHVDGAILPIPMQYTVGAIVTAVALVVMGVINMFVQRWMWWSIGVPRPTKDCLARVPYRISRENPTR